MVFLKVLPQVVVAYFLQHDDVRPGVTDTTLELGELQRIVLRPNPDSTPLSHSASKLMIEMALVLSL